MTHSMEPASRLPSHLEVAAMIRAVQAAGGFATVLNRGDRDSGAILIVTCENGGDSVLYERVADAELGRKWVASRRADPQNPSQFNDILQMRSKSDPDGWIVELDIANAARFIPGIVPASG